MTVWTLKRDGEIVAEHSTRLACVIEAIERKLVVQSRRMRVLVDGVTITPAGRATIASTEGENT